jgi:hypothetical protein
MSLVGKGFFLWQLPKCDGGDPEKIALRASAAHLSHALIKIADGSDWPYNVDRERDIDLVPPVRDALRQVGVSVWGWQYVRGDNPVGEARLAISRMKELGLQGLVVNAEEEYKQRGRRDRAKRYMQELRAEFPDLPIALSSFRYPTHHRAFPFEEFLEYCDYAMPQVYYEGAHNPEVQLERCVETYSVLRPTRPIIPTAPAYATRSWRPTPEELTRFMAKARSMGMSAANAWSWDFATRPAFVEFWDAIAAFDWPAAPSGADTPERLVHSYNQRDPAQAVELYHENAAHVTGPRTVVGRSRIYEWYRVFLGELLDDGVFTLTGKNGSGNSLRFTWKADASRGQVLDGSDTLGLRDGLIQYHYSHFTIQ